jgi:hypothetical protein
MQFKYRIGSFPNFYVQEINSNEEISYWSFTDLKKIKPINFLDSATLKSFTRSKKYISEKYPELLI